MQQVYALDVWLEYTRDNSIASRNKLVEANLKMVYAVCHSLLKQGTAYAFNLEELSQQGVLGLIKAVERFKPEKGNQFSTFAYPYIRGAIQQHIRDKGSTIRFPQTKQEELGRFWKAQKEAQEIHIKPTWEELRVCLQTKDQEKELTYWLLLHQNWQSVCCLSLNTVYEQGKLEKESQLYAGDSLPSLTDQVLQADPRINAVLSTIKLNA